MIWNVVLEICIYFFVNDFVVKTFRNKNVNQQSRWFFFIGTKKRSVQIAFSDVIDKYFKFCAIKFFSF